jgi:hypothetical protein
MLDCDRQRTLLKKQSHYLTSSYRDAVGSSRSSSSGIWEGDRNDGAGSLNEVKFLQIQAYSAHPEVLAMADLIVDSYLSTKAKRHDREGLIRCARKLIASLWLHPSDLFRFSTRAEHFGKSRTQVWMSHKVLTLFKHMRDMKPAMFKLVTKAIPAGISRDGIGRSSVYCRSWHFTNTLRELKQSDMTVDPDLPRITLRSDEGIWLPIPAEVREEPWYAFTEDTLRLHSEMLYKADIRLSDGSEMPPHDWHYFRRFKGSTRVTGRLYSTFATYPKARRLGITFMGQPAMSVDLTALHPNLLLRLLHQRDHEQPGLFVDRTDPYEMPLFSHLPRAVHKKLINTLFNAESIDSAQRSLLNTHYWYEPQEDRIEVVSYSCRSRRRGLKAFPQGKSEVMAYVDHFRIYHPDFSYCICSGAGKAMQRLDSELMLWAMRLGVEVGCPILPVHDEVVFPEHWRAGVLHILTRSANAALGGAGGFGKLPLVTTGAGGGGVFSGALELAF